MAYSINTSDKGYVLFDIRAVDAPSMPANDRRGAYLGTVHAMQTEGIAGLYDPETNTIVVPRTADLLQCIPHRWRDAFSHTYSCWPKDGRIGSKGHITLTGSTGKVLARITLESRYFKP